MLYLRMEEMHEDRKQKKEIIEIKSIIETQKVDIRTIKIKQEKYFEEIKLLFHELKSKGEEEDCENFPDANEIKNVK